MALTPDDRPVLPIPVVPPKPSASALRRVLRRARDGVALNVDEAAVAMTARGDDLADLCASAARVRDAGLSGPSLAAAADQLLAQGLHPRHAPVPRPVSLLHVRDGPGQAARGGRRDVHGARRDRRGRAPRRRIRLQGSAFHPRRPSGGAMAGGAQWLHERGYDTTLDYVRAMSIRVLEETGLLPHLNPGVMSWSELSRLKPVAPSMGMMLETTSRRLFETKGLAHYGSPDKDPAVRLRTLTDAGRLSIPFTTGLLVGIGETLARARRDVACDPQVAQGVRARPGSDRAELPRQARHRDACGARRRLRRLRRDGGGGAAGARAEDAHPGAAEPGVAQRVSGADRRRGRRLGWGVAADARSRQPGTTVAGAGRVGVGDRRGRVRVGAAADCASAVRAGGSGVDRSAGARTCRGAGRPCDRVRARRQSRGPAVAGARRGAGVLRPRRPERRHRHRGPADRDAQ